MRSKALVLDANILIRAVLGQGVRRILESHADSISFFLPEIAYAEAEEHLAALVVQSHRLYEATHLHAWSGNPYDTNAIVYTEYAVLEAEKIRMREFRENLAGYLKAGKPLAITRRGETLGFYIPAQKKSRAAAVDAMRAAAKELP